MYQGPHTNFNKEDNDGTCKSYNELIFHGHTTGNLLYDFFINTDCASRFPNFRCQVTL